MLVDFLFLGGGEDVVLCEWFSDGFEARFDLCFLKLHDRTEFLLVEY